VFVRLNVSREARESEQRDIVDGLPSSVTVTDLA